MFSEARKAARNLKITGVKEVDPEYGIARGIKESLELLENYGIMRSKYIGKRMKIYKVPSSLWETKTKTEAILLINAVGGVEKWDKQAAPKDTLPPKGVHHV